jgi:hypothetical protein
VRSVGTRRISMSAGQTNGSPGDASPGQRLSRRERVGLFLGRGLAALPDPADRPS